MDRRPKTLLQKSADRASLIFLAGSLVFLYLLTFILPHTPILQGDTAPIFLLDAVRMLQGDVIYRDFFELTLPGTPLVYQASFRVFGIRAWIPNAMLILLGVSLSWLSIGISKRLMNAGYVLLPSLLFLTFVFGNTLDANHHWYSTLAIIGALALLIEGRSHRHIAMAGALCGVATCFTQSRGVVSTLGFAAFLIWEFHKKGQSWRELVKAEFCLIGPMLGITVPLIAYFAWKAGMHRFLFCAVTFVRLYYGEWRWNKLSAYMTEAPDFSSWLELPALGIWLFIHALVPLIFLLVFVRYLERSATQAQEPWDRLMLVNVTGLFLFLGVAFAPVWERLCMAALPGLILFVWFIRASTKYHRVILSGLGFVALAVAIVKPAMTQAGVLGCLDTPRGRIAFASTTFAEPEAYEKFEWLLHRTRPSEFFFNARDADMYFMLNLRTPAEVPFLTTSDYTRPEQVLDVLNGLQAHRVRFVMWWPELDLPDDAAHPEGDHLGPVRAYLRRHYHVVKTFTDGTQVWERSM